MGVYDRIRLDVLIQLDGFGDGGLPDMDDDAVRCLKGHKFTRVVQEF